MGHRGGEKAHAETEKGGADMRARGIRERRATQERMLASGRAGRAGPGCQRERMRLGARWRGRKGADGRGRLVRAERLAWCRGKVEEAGRGAGIVLLGRVSGPRGEGKEEWAAGVCWARVRGKVGGLGCWFWAGKKRKWAMGRFGLCAGLGLDMSFLFFFSSSISISNSNQTI